MSLTREHIDKLVARFSGYREPPAIYISEYEEFTSKLHDFSIREQQLKEKLRLQSIDNASPTLEQPDNSASKFDNLLMEEQVENPPASPYDYNGHPQSHHIHGHAHARSYLHPSEHLPLDSPSALQSSGDEFGSFATADHSNSSSQPSSACVPKSPVKAIVRAHLGDHGHTFVSTKPGTTVREALSKAMKLRKLAPETCAVYNVNDPNKVRNEKIFFGIFH